MISSLASPLMQPPWLRCLWMSRPAWLAYGPRTRTSAGCSREGRHGRGDLLVRGAVEAQMTGRVGTAELVAELDAGSDHTFADLVRPALGVFVKGGPVVADLG